MQLKQPGASPRPAAAVRLGRDQSSSGRVAGSARTTCAWYLLLAAAFPWHEGDSAASAARGGALDALKLGVLAAAVILASAGRENNRLPPTHKLFGVLALLTAVSALLATEPSLEGAFRSARLAVVVVSVYWVSSYLGLVPILYHTVMFVTAIAALSLCAWAVGLEPLDDGRLRGFFPPVHPNVLASAVAFGTICALLLWSYRRLTGVVTATIIALLLVTLLQTGSRTAVASSLDRICRLGTSRRGDEAHPNLRLLWIFLLLVVGTLLVRANVAVAPIADALTRGGSAQIDGTLTGRVYGWSAALEFHTSLLHKIIGQGLQIKSVPRQLGVGSMSMQGVDNSWIAAYVSAGILGVGILTGAVDRDACARVQEPVRRIPYPPRCRRRLLLDREFPGRSIVRHGCTARTFGSGCRRSQPQWRGDQLCRTCCWSGGTRQLRV